MCSRLRARSTPRHERQPHTPQRWRCSKTWASLTRSFAVGWSSRYFGLGTDRTASFWPNLTLAISKTTHVTRSPFNASNTSLPTWRSSGCGVECGNEVGTFPAYSDKPTRISGFENSRAPCSQRKFSTGAHHAPKFADQALHVRHKENRKNADDSIEVAVRVFECCHICESKLHIREAGCRCLCTRSVKQARGQIDSNYKSTLSDDLRSGQRRSSRPATNVEHFRARRQFQIGYGALPNVFPKTEWLVVKMVSRGVIGRGRLRLCFL